MAALPDPDARLMIRVKNGDREAFAEIVEKYKQPMLNLIYRTIGDPVEAEDLAQQAFVQAYRAAHRYREDARLSTWLFTIARNLCFNELRRRARHPAESLDLGRPEEPERPLRSFEDRTHPGPAGHFLRSELEQKVEESIQALPANQRLALLLCREEELSYEEIAQILGCSLSATKSLIHRARETLKTRLKPYLESGNWEP